MTEYDVFAPFYDRAMALGGDTGAKVDRIETWIRHYHPRASSLLELACGTGTILRELSSRYQVTGLDKSPAMLRLAGMKVPQAELHLGDMADFTLSRRFDVVLCIFDSVNHLPEFAQWQALFKHAGRHLQPGGLLIFDINTVGRLRRLMAMPPWSVRIGDFRLEMAVRPGTRFLTDWHIKITEPGAPKHDRVHQETIGETAFPISKVQESVEQHFSVLERESGNGEPADDDADRVYFVCRLL